MGWRNRGKEMIIIVLLTTACMYVCMYVHILCVLCSGSSDPVAIPGIPIGIEAPDRRPTKRVSQFKYAEYK